MTQTAAPIELRAPAHPLNDTILSQDALEFLGALHREFGDIPDLSVLLQHLHNGRLLDRNRAMVALASHRKISSQTICGFPTAGLGPIDRKVARLHLDATPSDPAWQVLTPEPGWHQALVSPHSGSWVHGWSDANTPPRAEVRTILRGPTQGEARRSAAALAGRGGQEEAEPVHGFGVVLGPIEYIFAQRHGRISNEVRAGARVAEDRPSHRVAGVGKPERRALPSASRPRLDLLSF